MKTYRPHTLLLLVLAACGDPDQAPPDGPIDLTDAAPDAQTDASDIDAPAGKTCGGQVAVLTDPATGCADPTSCTACLLPSGATATACTAGACDFTCPAGTTKTATECAPPVTAQATRISAGGWHTCAVTAAGGVKCWGYNDRGRLGDGTTTDRHVAVDVVGLASGVATVAAGGGHTCAVTTAGGAKCWGGNFVGQLGTNSFTNSSIPVDVPGLTSGVIAIATGNIHTCAVTSIGGVKCWGSNTHGELGNNSAATYSSVPVDVTGLSSGAVAIAAGAVHTCAVMASGGVKCWGDNTHGQLGNNSTVRSLVPVDVSALTNATQIAIGGDTMFSRSHSCALTATGGIKCWGNHGFGQLGTGGFESGSPVPVNVSGMTSGVIAIGAGDLHGLGVTSANAVKGWGDGSSGQLGTATSTESLGPLALVSLASGITAIAGGGKHTCALTSTGGVKCMGTNGNGQLGNNSTVKATTAVDVIGFQ